MTRPTQAARRLAGRPQHRPRRMRLAGANQPLLATLTIRLGTGEYVDIQYRPYLGSLLAVHTTRHGQAEHGYPIHRGRLEPRPAEVVTPTRARFLTTTGRRGTAAGTILAHGGVHLDSAVTVADALDLLSSAALTSVGITAPDDARAILGALWATR